MIRKIVFAFAALLPTLGYAQTVEHLVVASQFNNWRTYAQSGPYGNTSIAVGANTISANPCSVQGDPNHTIPVFAANTPVRIVDLGTPSLSEVFTPTTVSNGGCTATFTAVNAHGSNYFFTSGTYGLQEAINAYAATGSQSVIEADSAWQAAGGGYSTIYGAAGNANLSIQLITLSPSSTFRWNGTHYLPFTEGNTGTLSVAAGAAAGTSPTIANTTGSTANTWTVTLTTGTSPTTGTLFTETTTVAFPSPGANCVAQSVGANNLPPITVVQTSTTVTTFTVATAPAASTPYVISGSCN